MPIDPAIYAKDACNAIEAFKQQLDINKPEEYLAKLRALEKEVANLGEEFGKIWSYCPGCVRSRGVMYARVAEAYESTTDPANGRPVKRVLRCGACHSIWKNYD